jgi:hypothetical protein
MVSGPDLSSTRARVLLLAAMITPMTGLISSLYPSTLTIEWTSDCAPTRATRQPPP